MRIIDNETGRIYDDGVEQPFQNSQPFNGLNATEEAPVPDARQLADFFGVPVKWVIIAGIAFLILPTIFGKGR